MGKSRRNRSGAARRDPISKPIKPPSDPELAALREQKILPVIKDLQSAEPKQRSAAASAIANIIQDARCRKLLLREQVVNTVLTQTLTDAALESRAAGWGILQVLAQEEEADFCVHLYRLDVLTAMEFASKMVSDKLSSQDPSFQSLPKAEKAFILSITSSLISLATALVEAQDDILEALSANATITSLIFGIVTESHQSEEITTLRSDALACLMLMSEDNAKFAEKILIQNHTVYENLQALRKDVSGDGVLACGILHNIFLALQGRTVDEQIVDDSAIIPTLTKAVAGIAPGQSTANGSGWSNPFEYQQLALEILASIGTSLNAAAGDAPTDEKKPGPAEPEEDEEMDDAEDNEADEEVDGQGAGEEDGEVEGEEDDEMDEDAMHADMDMVTGADDEDPSHGIDDLPVLKSLLQHALPELNRVAALQASNPEAMQLQGLALSALNNIAWSVSLIDFSHEHNTGIQKAWTPIGQDIWTKVIAPILAGDTADVTLATQVTSLAWAVARTLHGESANTTPIQNEHRKFIALYQATRGADTSDPSTSDPFQSLGVKCIGVLGQLALPPAPISLNRDVGTFLMTLLSSLPEANTPPADAVEALNQLFDIYGDEESPCDKEVFWKDSYLEHLEDVLPKVKTMVKTVDKREQPELRARADETVLNLTRFMAYKKKHQPS